mgnify:CR=1 FL=1
MQKIVGGCRVVIAANIDGGAAKDRTQQAAGLAMTVDVGLVGIGGTATVADR